MGTNDNRDRKLLHHEKPIWRKAFEESMKHTSIEGATRNAWKAVDEWNRAGAFNETTPQPSGRVHESGSQQDYREAFDVLCTWLGSMSGSDGLSETQTDKLWLTVKDFDEGKIDVKELHSELESIVPIV